MALPPYIALEGDNGKYLSVVSIRGIQYLQFSSDNIENPMVRMEVVNLSGGRVRIKSCSTGKFWRQSLDWILPDSDDPTHNDLNTVFQPSKLENDVHALQHLGNKLYCERQTAGAIIDCLKADTDDITSQARLKVHELAK